MVDPSGARPLILYLITDATKNINKTEFTQNVVKES